MSLPASPRRALIAAAVAALLAAIGLTLMPPPSNAAFSTAQCQGANVLGRGASFPNTAHAAWKVNFANVFCGGVAPDVTWDGAGSGAGLETMGVRRGGNVDGKASRTGTPRFAGTDDPPTPTQVAQMNGGSDAAGDEGNVQVIPAAVGAVAPLVNFPNNCDVNLLPVGEKTAEQNKDGGAVDDVVRVLFTKTKWEAAWRKDSAADNWTELFPELAADADCDKPIIRVVRFDASGTTFAFKSYLNTINPGEGWSSKWEGGSSPADNRAWPSSTFGTRVDCKDTPSGPGTNPAEQLTSGCASGAGQMVDKVIATDGSIGYADVAAARTRTPSLAIEPEKNDNDTYWTQLQNGSGAFTEPTADPDGFRTDGTKGANCASTVFTGTPASTYGDWSKATGVNAALGYGLCTMTYGLVFEDNAPVWGVGAEEEAKARTVRDYWAAIVSDGGQGILFANDYSPLPANMLAIARAGVATIDWNKQGLGGGGGGGGGQQPPTGGGGGEIIAPPPAPPSNVFSVPSTALNSKKGNATLSIRLPGAGQLVIKGTNGKGKKRITVANLRRNVSKAGTVKVTLTPGSKALSVLKKKGTLKVNVTVTFTPTGGTARSSSKTVTLKYVKPKKGKKGKG